MSRHGTVKAIRDCAPSVQEEKWWCWSIVLAGGDGRGMVDWIETRLGEPRPKQFCVFTGSRTILQHTLDRAVQVAPARNTVTVIGRGHRRFLFNSHGTRVPGQVIEQPADRGTAGEVLLSATYVRASDPGATVLILPSDHFVHPDHLFQRHAAHACRLTDRFKDRFVVLGATARSAETDCGWILPERRHLSPILRGLGYEVWTVDRFREKPPREEAARLFRAGGLWNTQIVAVKVKTLWAAGRRLLPGMVNRFDFLHRVLRSVRARRETRRREAEVLRDIYLDMKPADFSRDLLQHVASSALVHPMRDVEWSDWGRPERVEQTLRRLIDGGCQGELRSPVPAAIAAWCRPDEDTVSGTAAIGDRQ